VSSICGTVSSMGGNVSSIDGSVSSMGGNVTSKGRNELQLAAKVEGNLAEDDGIKDGGSLGAVTVVWVAM
jgi:hypothetical protein